MTIISSWICPACGKREKYKDDENHDFFMQCHCPHCHCEFTVDVWSTDAESEQNRIH